MPGDGFVASGQWKNVRRLTLASSVDSNVDTCLQIMPHRIDLAAVRAPPVMIMIPGSGRADRETG